MCRSSPLRQTDKRASGRFLSHQSTHHNVLGCHEGGKTPRRMSVTSEEAGLGVAPHLPPQPVSSWRPTTIVWTCAFFGRTLSVSHHLPSHWVACLLRVVRSPVVFLFATPR